MPVGEMMSMVNQGRVMAVMWMSNEALVRNKRSALPYQSGVLCTGCDNMLHRLGSLAEVATLGACNSSWTL
jgi:hypothetical protein